ncbi:uncharacterized protein B0P05DRAFT_366323 [Gilbertella persicaria]|uniref:uncharacterized protein n=1 Tax=Gilbertella persicaria TaxID=101096 RepID=UPI00221F9F77|nr:uncharacterized protein B0P05DRAFT_366323 [Gilbertella persicaria]KAI8047240.1 hypothetical protein B0P05DRAFT_366323 [Gilbertella persicaria]
MKPDPRYDNLVVYTNKLKTELLSHTLTPLELSLVKHQGNDSSMDEALPSLGDKRDLEEEDEQDELESEYSDKLSTRKRFKSSFEDPLFSSDPSVPGATLGFSSAEQTQQQQEEEDQVPVKTIAEVNVVDDGSRTQEGSWQCSKCQYTNAAYIQTCGICHQLRAQIDTFTIPAKPTQIRTDYSQHTAAADHMVHATPAPSNNTRLKTDPQVAKEAHILYTGLSPEDDKMLENIKREAESSRLKIFIHYKMREFDEITHIITSVNKDRLCKRTMKYLQGVLAGKWIVYPKWLIDSIKANQWQLEMTYEVQGDQLSGKTLAPSKSRHHKEPLFQNQIFYFYGEFTGKHNKNDLLILCRTGGAKVLSRKPTTQDAIIIVPEGYKRKKSNVWLDQYTVKDPVWLIQCISTFKAK